MTDICEPTGTIKESTVLESWSEEQCKEKIRASCDGMLKNVPTLYSDFGFDQDDVTTCYDSHKNVPIACHEQIGVDLPSVNEFCEVWAPAANVLNSHCEYVVESCTQDSNILNNPFNFVAYTCALEYDENYTFEQYKKCYEDGILNGVVYESVPGSESESKSVLNLVLSIILAISIILRILFIYY